VGVLENCVRVVNRGSGEMHFFSCDHALSWSPAFLGVFGSRKMLHQKSLPDRGPPSGRTWRADRMMMPRSPQNARTLLTQVMVTADSEKARSVFSPRAFPVLLLPRSAPRAPRAGRPRTASLYALGEKQAARQRLPRGWREGPRGPLPATRHNARALCGRAPVLPPHYAGDKGSDLHCSRR